jgi:hypothetical protein
MNYLLYVSISKRSGTNAVWATRQIFYDELVQALLHIPIKLIDKVIITHCYSSKLIILVGKIFTKQNVYFNT